MLDSGRKARIQQLEKDKADRGGGQFVVHPHPGPVGGRLSRQEALDEHHLVLLPDGQVHPAVRCLEQVLHERQGDALQAYRPGSDRGQFP